jgi:hypothetical protein
MSLEEHCIDQEHKRWIDDCGSVGCRLTGATWNEWAGQDNCADCEYAISHDTYAMMKFEESVGELDGAFFPEQEGD